MNKLSLSILRYVDTNEQNAVWYVMKSVVLCIVVCEQGCILCNSECFFGFHAHVPLITILSTTCQPSETKKLLNLM
jgi:hypothetical protein